MQQLPGPIMHCAIDCDVITKTNRERVKHGVDVLKSFFIFATYMGSLFHVIEQEMYAISWRTPIISAIGQH